MKYIRCPDWVAQLIKLECVHRGITQPEMAALVMERAGFREEDIKAKHYRESVCLEDLKIPGEYNRERASQPLDSNEWAAKVKGDL